MVSARPLSFVLLVSLVLVINASAALAADDAARSDSSNQNQIASTSKPDVAAESLQQASGLVLSLANAGMLNRPPHEGAPFAKLDNGVCYTMRMYKLKRTERLSDSETAARGYTTCELAKNYQVRSAVANSIDAELKDSRK